jgi:hypothetical protein
MKQCKCTLESGSICLEQLEQKEFLNAFFLYKHFKNIETLGKGKKETQSFTFS